MVRFFGCGFRGLGVRFSKNDHFWAFLGVWFFRGTVFGCGFRGAVFEAARRPKTIYD